MTDTTQDEANAEDMADMKAVYYMLEAAAAARMSVEVVLAFAKHVKNGDSIQEAAACATYDWDC